MAKWMIFVKNAYVLDVRHKEQENLLVSERNFYYQKLRQIEILLQVGVVGEIDAQNTSSERDLTENEEVILDILSGRFVAMML